MIDHPSAHLSLRHNTHDYPSPKMCVVSSDSRAFDCAASAGILYVCTRPCYIVSGKYSACNICITQYTMSSALMDVEVLECAQIFDSSLIAAKSSKHNHNSHDNKDSQTIHKVSITSSDAHIATKWKPRVILHAKSVTTCTTADEESPSESPVNARDPRTTLFDFGAVEAFERKLSESPLLRERLEQMCLHHQRRYARLTNPTFKRYSAIIDHCVRVETRSLFSNHLRNGNITCVRPRFARKYIYLPPREHLRPKRTRKSTGRSKPS